MLQIYFGEMEESIYNTSMYFFTMKCSGYMEKITQKRKSTPI